MRTFLLLVAGFILGIGHLVGWSLNFFCVYLLKLPMVDFSLLLILGCLLRLFPVGKNFSADGQNQGLQQGQIRNS